MENNIPTDKTDQSAGKSPTPTAANNWRDYYGYRRHWFLPKLILIIIVAGLAFMFGAMTGGHRLIGHRYIGQFNQTERPAFQPRLGGMMEMGGHRLGHRMLGAITAISGGNLTIHNSSADQTVIITDTTSIYRDGAMAKQSDLKVGDVITVSGQPNSNGQINATVIQVQ